MNAKFPLPLEQQKSNEFLQGPQKIQKYFQKIKLNKKTIACSILLSIATALDPPVVTASETEEVQTLKQYCSIHSHLPRINNDGTGTTFKVKIRKLKRYLGEGNGPDCEENEP